MKNIIALFVVVLLSGCASKIVGIVGNDLQTTSDMAKKYGRDDVALCADWLLSKKDLLVSSDDKIAQLRAEKTSGILSRALQLDMIREELNKQRTAIDQQAFKKDFEKNCQGVAGAIAFAALEDARKYGSRGQ